MANQTSRSIRAYIGTYTDTQGRTPGRREGIYSFHVDPTTGAWTFIRAFEAGENPSFLAVHPTWHFLYTVNEAGDPTTHQPGFASAFAIDPASAELKLLNQQPTHGAHPCHLSVDQTGRYVLVANYTGGSVCVFPIQADGGLGEATDFIQFQGAGINAERQEGPHAHQIIPDPLQRNWFVCDLGTDRIMSYRLDLERGKLMPNDPPFAQVRAGAGPRHLTFHPNGRLAYVINELGNTVTALAYDAARGSLGEIETISTLPEGFNEVSYCADIHVHPSGKFIYGSNRGHNSIAIFSIDEDTGKLTPVGHESTRGDWPRNFAIHPSGVFLHVANQKSDAIVSFRVDTQTGRLTPAGHVIDVPMPVCVQFLDAPLGSS